MFLRRVVATVVIPLHVVTLLLIAAPPVQAQIDIDLRQVITTTVGQLNPVSAALGPLIDRAIASGETAVQRRLEQLNSIIQATIFNLDQMLKTNIERLDAAAKQRIAQAVQGASVLIMQAQATLNEGLGQLDAYLAANIDRLQMAAANAIATLPISTDPLLSVGPNGIATVKQTGTHTEVMVSGSSLFKKGEKPKAFLVDPSGATNAIDVASASMGLLQLRIPNRLLADTVAATSYVVRLELLRGGKFLGVGKSYTKPSFPLRVCGALRAYEASVKASATGEVWLRRVICHPESQGVVKGNDCGFYLQNDRRNGNTSRDVCPYGTDGYEVDTDPAPNTVNGLTVLAEGGDNDHSANRMGNGCIHMYAGWNNDRGSHEWIGGVYIRQKKRVAGQACGPEQASTVRLSYVAPSTVQINRTALSAACVEPGLSASPAITTTVQVRALDNSRPPEIVNLVENVSKPMLGNLASAVVDNAGLVTLILKPECRFQYDFRTQ